MKKVSQTHKQLPLWLGFFLSLLFIFPAQALETKTYYHLDAVGSPVAATDESGAVVWRDHYRPYGDRQNKDKLVNQTNSRWFTGHAEDKETGLSYMGARYYDPIVGRFMGIDPVSFKESNIHSFNRYAYANNNPYKFIDPDGRDPWMVLNGSELTEHYASVLGVDPYTIEGANSVAQHWRKEAIIQAEIASGIVMPARLIGNSVVVNSTGKFLNALSRYPKRLGIEINKTTKQLSKSYKSYRKTVADHNGYIKNPRIKVKDWDSRSKRYQEGLIKKWKKDIDRNQAYADIAEQILQYK